jgi:hypothetical protein
MSLSPPAVAREPIHTRRIECHGYLRADGLWDVEGHLTDVKTYAFENTFRGAVPPGTPVHEMWIRVTVDTHLVIHDIEAATDHSPFPICPAATVNFSRLKGLRISAGFLSQVRKLLGGTEGCTHLVELMGPIATTAFQSIFPYRERLRQAAGKPSSDPQKKPLLLDTCHGFASDGEVVKQLWPKFYTGS